MANKEIVSVLKVDTGQSENTIKSLKAEIAQLKKSLETAEIGSEEFARASRDLAAAQANLKTVMADGKRTADAVEGSYNHMVATMAELKKQWRATADEAKRNEIGKQIDAINTKLKDMDATIGNHQRNVGNYKGDIIEAFDEMGGEVKTYGERWSEMQKSTEQTRAKFESVQKMASGLASGFAAVQGAAALFGLENENLEKTLVKVQAAMAIAQGIGGMKDLIEGFTQGKTAFQGATMGLQTFKTEAVATQATMAGTTVATNASTTAVKGFRKALISTGIGAILVGIGVAIAAIVENWDKLTRALGINKKEQKEVNKAIEESIEREKERKNEVNSSVGSIIGKYKLLQRQWKELSSVEEKNAWINKNRDAFNDLGIAINDVNTAQSVFVTNSEAVIKAIKDQARARAMAKLYEDAIAKQYIAQQELDDAKQTAKQRYYNGYVPTDEEAENAGLGDGDYGTLTRESSLYEQWIEGEGKYTTDNYDWVDGGGARKLQDVYTKPFQQSVDAINGEVAKLEEAFVEAEKTAAESAAAVKELGIDYNGDGSGSSSSSSSSTDDPAAEAKRIAERAKQALIDTKEEELAELRRIYKEELALLKKHHIDTGDLTKEFLDKETDLMKDIASFGGNEQEQIAALDKFYTERIKEYEKYGISTVELTAQWEAEKNAIIENFETQRQAAQQRIANDGKSQKELELQELKEEYDTYVELFKDHKEQMLLVDQWYQQQKGIIEERYKEKQEETESGTTATHKQTMAEFIDSYGEMYKKIREGAGETAANVAIAFTQALSSASEILGAIQAGIDTSTEEGFEKSKKFQIAQAVISMAQGILAAVSSAMMIPPPMGPILGAINAGTVATVGGIQIANIKKQTFGGSSGDIGNLNGMGIANPSLPDMIPINYTRSLMTDTETAELNKQNRVYVVESDITDTQDNVKVKESNSNF